MIYLILRWVINALALTLVSIIIPGFHVESFYAALVAALMLGVVNMLIRPILIILTLPINVLSLGILTLFINGLMVFLVSTIVKGFNIDNYAAAFFAAVFIWLINMVSNFIFESRQAKK